jgi:hypothetical protein
LILKAKKKVKKHDYVRNGICIRSKVVASAAIDENQDSKFQASRVVDMLRPFCKRDFIACRNKLFISDVYTKKRCVG